ncbi:AbrB/MazE/SpoVT family DNA-binding domain-containing protein [Halobacillus sp. H74]|uniref:AbrB/MazE/SpoVT family DNA-binding domain-containing protein n=1 Tax=Halobacillus sp. H74 TaxID=3457436 RepID=UPI003FCE96E5
MIPTQKNIDLSNKSDFTIPVKWKRKLHIEEGVTVTLRVKNNNIVIKPSDNKTHDVMSTVGRKGRIYVPKETRDYFKHKRLRNFHIHIEEGEKAIILKP